MKKRQPEQTAPHQQEATSEIHDSAAWFQRGQAAQAGGKIEEAIAAFRKTLSSDKNHMEAHLALGTLLAYQGQVTSDAALLREATFHLSTVLRENQKHIGALTNLAKCCSSLGEIAKAKTLFREVVALEPQAADAWSCLANLAEAQGNIERAMEYVNGGLEKNPGEMHLLHQKAVLLDRLNRIGEARAIFEELRGRQPNNPATLFGLARIAKREKRIDDCRALLESALACCETPVQKAPILNLLAQVAEQQGNPDEAWGLLLQSKEIRQNLPQNQTLRPEAYITMLETSRTYYTKERVEKWAPVEPARSPMFLIGFPRSGTTLAEQIISVHPETVVSEEAPVMDRIINALPHILKRPFDYPQDIGTLTPAEIKALQSLYWQLMEQELRQPLAGKNLLAKMPFNLPRLGLIYRLFPFAKIITLHRDPRDVVISCFFQNFALGNATANFHTLAGTVQLYDKMMNLYAHYRTVLPITCHEVPYEALVREPEANIRAMVEYLGFEWDEAYLHYYDKAYKRSVSTPSYEGITKPLYEKSIGRWKSYATQLEPHLPTLKPHLERLGYL